MFKHCLRILRNASLLVAVCSAAVYAQPLANAPEIEKLEQKCLIAKIQEQCRDVLSSCGQAEEAMQRQPMSRERDLRRAALWHHLATCKFLLGQYAEAERLHSQALAVRGRLLGTAHLEVAESGHNLADVLQAQGKYVQAEELFRQALSIRQRLLGSNDPVVAQSLSSLGVSLQSQGKNVQARENLLLAISIQQRLLGAEHGDVAASLNNLAAVLVDEGKYDQAEASIRRALSMQQKLLGMEHVDVAASLNNLAAVLSFQGKYAQAEVVIQQALSMRQRLLGTHHPEVAESLNNLAEVLDFQGKSTQAELNLREALAIRQKVLGTEHPETLNSLNDLANLLIDKGKYDQAEDMHRQVLSIRQKILGNEHLQVAQSLNNLAYLDYCRKKYARAEELYRKALSIRKKQLGNEHPIVAESLNDLASTLNEQHKYVEAEDLHRQVLSVRQKLLGAVHPKVAESLNNLAATIEHQGKFDQAMTLYQKSLSIWQKQLGIEHPKVAVSLHNLAHLLQHQGQYQQAETLHHQALSIWKTQMGTDHPKVAGSLNSLASLLVQRGQLDAALPYLIQAARIRENILRSTVSEARMRAALDEVRGEEDTVYGLLLEYPNHVGLQQLALTTALLRKGRAAEAGMLANLVLQRTPSTGGIKERFEEWQLIRQERESLLFGSRNKLSRDEQRNRLAELGQRSEDLEIQLAAQLPELRALQPPAFDQILSAVADRLPKGGVFIEVVWVEPLNFKAGKDAPRWNQPHYIAMVLGGDGDTRIAVKDLGEADAVNRHLQALLTALRSPTQDPKRPAQTVYEQVLRPLLPAHAEHIYLSLDGALNLIPFDALHDGKDYLLGQRSFHYLTSGRDLLRRDAAPSRQAAVVMADPDLGNLAGRPDDAGTYYARLSGLPGLPRARHEAAVIAALLSVAPLFGSAATETVVRAAHAPWVLHIASHGIFFHGEDVLHPQAGGMALPESGPTDRSALVMSTQQPKPINLAGDLASLSQSALVLAGAARGKTASSTAEDGLLTAEEARSLDLLGTQLVVLSACDTGQGALSAGHGVYGLRRAFLIAGAETLVTSLWPVNDAATGKLMELYYQKLFREKQGRLTAMQSAMKQMRANYDHPYYWAPFLVIGSDAPLRIPQTKAP